MNAIERYHAALAGQPVDRLPCHPLTMMFASRLIGRTFYDYVTDYRVLAEGQLAVVERFGIDFVSTISDPCREVHDLGGTCTYFEDEAPANEQRHALLRDKSVLAGLTVPDPLGGGRMHDRVKGVELLRQRVGGEMSVLGWVEGPMAMAVDLRGMESLMMDTVDDPTFVTDLFEFSVAMELEFAKVQLEAGADSIGVGDAAASLIGAETYADLVLPHAQRLVQTIRSWGAKVRLHVCGRTTHLFEHFATLGCELVDVDYLGDLATARRELPETALLGNIDPVSVLFQASPEVVAARLAECHAVCGTRFVVGAGCEVPKQTPHENLRALVDYARHGGWS
ncbi:MAG: uroporphyrinogen decarboxylase family protein [Armatimonadetes bacterium]|nr:uroporphyrinogen decarboxylase family protein [Armatimonadota bacterium]